ncbi:Z1 domain-containing protein [Pseudarthrobacter sp. S6]|uniref:Z1 domain-containing protein n=1 Tax=Pseudarthrobacter sp. S6 TaxID=3418420 RepID=UPI003CEFB314
MEETSSSSAVREAIISQLKVMGADRPKSLLVRVNNELKVEDLPSMTEEELISSITADNVNDPIRMEFQLALARWDATSQGEWFEGSEPATIGRRDRILTLLGFSVDAKDAVNGQWPVRADEGDIVIATEADPWYTDERAKQHSFYWPAYRGVLAGKGWPAEAIADLDVSTREVVSRLSDPTNETPYQSKGLVVGYVQSGKTAQFAGTIAKSIDAGYRLIIVLAGTLNMLRTQTQRRLDMELVGKENIIGGMDVDDPDHRKEIDYLDDTDWDNFLSHGVQPSDAGFVDIVRLSGYADDYKRLKKGLNALEFRTGLRDKTKPLYHPDNLYKADAKIVVVKKNTTVLKKLVSDLKSLKISLAEIPTLIIDDESDQASISTKRPTAAEKKERTAVNREITNLLGALKRAQYVGYTATPFANVFVDPDDAADIFPNDFIIALKRPAGYMGAKDFHDLGVEFENGSKSFATSNEAAFIRSVQGDEPDSVEESLRSALDAYLLSGAVKLYRADKSELSFRHHTMLVHESVKMIQHRDTADVLRELWAQGGYSSSGLPRLEKLWAADYLPVSEARAEDKGLIPASFDELRPYIGKALDKINSSQNPVLVVNGDKDLQTHQEALNFDTGSVWRILVGGTKLSRGFTVEGLTVSYYRRKTLAADTLMQMGRWFGFRGGYRDLVRLYIGRAELSGQKYFDLYEAFESIVIDEELFREELARYAELDDEGKPQVRPRDVPPLVTQHLQWLAPTAANKRYNAVVTERGEGGRLKDLNALPAQKDILNRSNFQAVKPLIESAVNDAAFVTDSGSNYAAKYGLVSADDFIQVLVNTTFGETFDIEPQLQFLKKASADGRIKDWVVIVPELTEGTTVTVDGLPLNVLKRKRREERQWAFSGSSRRQRVAVEAIADPRQKDGTTQLVEELRTPTRGAILLTAAHDPRGKHLVSNPSSLSGDVDPAVIAVMMSYAAPYASAPKGKIGFTVRSQMKANAAILSAGDDGYNLSDHEARLAAS